MIKPDVLSDSSFVFCRLRFYSILDGYTVSPFRPGAGAQTEEQEPKWSIIQSLRPRGWHMRKLTRFNQH